MHQSYQAKYNQSGFKALSLYSVIITRPMSVNSCRQESAYSIGRASAKTLCAVKVVRPASVADEHAHLLL